jgi:hypothetical protein
VDKEAEKVRRDMAAVCDASMLRSTPDVRRGGPVYWWTPDIAELTTECVQARRRYQRVRRRRLRDEGETSRCYEVYCEIRRMLQREIKVAKARA